VTELATAVCSALILGLIWLDRNPRVRTSWALWIVQVWFFFACSRPLARWLGIEDAEGSFTAQLSEGSPVDRFVGIILLLLALSVLLQRRRKLTQHLQHNWPIILFFAYCLVSILWSDFPMVSFKRWIRLVGDLLMVLIVWTDRHPFDAFKRLLSRAAFTLIPLSILLIKYYPSLGRVYGLFLGEVMYTGVATGKNELGAISMLFGIASVWQILNLLGRKQSANNRWQHLSAYTILLAMVLWLIYSAESMTALSCFLLGSFSLLCMRLSFFTKSRFSIHALSFAMVFIPASVALLGASPAALEAIGRNPSLTDRTLIWSQVVKLVPNRWIGSGYASFWLGGRLETMILNVTHHWVPNQAHNGYLEIYANLGWIGVALLSFVLFGGYWRVVHRFARDVPASHLLLSYFLVGLVSNITEASFFRIAIPVWLFFLFAVTAPQACFERTSRKTAAVSPTIYSPTEGVRSDDVFQAI